LAQGVLEACKEKNVLAIGDVIDQNSLAPKLIVSSTMIDFSVALGRMLDKIKAGTLKGDMIVLGMKDGAADIADFHGLVPADVAAKVEAVRKQIKDGSFTVPVFDKVPTDAQLDAAPKPKL